MEEPTPLTSTATGWYALLGGQTSGPYTWVELYGLAQQGHIGANGLVWHASLSAWVAAAQIPGLIQAGLPGTGPRQPRSHPAPHLYPMRELRIRVSPRHAFLHALWRSFIPPTGVLLGPTSAAAGTAVPRGAAAGAVRPGGRDPPDRRPQTP